MADAVETHSLVFQPLDERKQETRLIRLRPGPVSAPVECSLDVVSLADKPSYTALSYAWGSIERNHPIAINGEVLHITRSLHTALRYVRRDTEMVVLWVDAICICQEDELEKGKQVMMMGEIFRTAESTLLWVGEACDRAMDFLSTYCAGIPIIERLSEGAVAPGTTPLLESLQSFFARPWFRRLWALQEALLSPDPRIQCGSKRTEFTRVCQLCYDLSVTYRGYSTLDPFVNCPLKQVLREWYRIREEIGLKQRIVDERVGWPLIYSLPMTQNFECTIPKDKIFGLLGMASERDRKAIPADYTKSATEVYTRTSAYLLRSPENPLAALQYMGIRRKDSDLPSWARDWSVLPATQWSFWPAETGEERWQFLPSRTNFDADLSNVYVPSFSKDLRTMTIEGVIVDTVATVDRGPLLEDGVSGLKSKCRSWKSHALAQASNTSHSPDDRYEAFCKVLCGGRYRDSQDKRQTECRSAYESWIADKDYVEVESESGKEGESEKRRLHDLGHRAKRFCTNRSLITTAAGRVGLAPDHVEQDDLVCFFRGCRMPFILRKASDNFHEFVGETFVCGIMNRELGDAGETHLFQIK